MPIKLLSKELYQFFEQSAIWYHKLNGAWDPTLGPLSQFYGLQPSNLTTTKANALQQIGFDNVRILEPQHIQKNRRTHLIFHQMQKGMRSTDGSN